MLCIGFDQAVGSIGSDLGCGGLAWIWIGSVFGWLSHNRPGAD